MVQMTSEQIHAELDAMDARARVNRRIKKLENALADARRDHALLVRLVQRMGREFLPTDGSVSDRTGHRSSYPYTIPGQREYDAAMHEAEGPPPDAGMLEAVQ